MQNDDLQKTKALMGALLRMPPRLHSEMKLNKPPKPHKPKRNKRGRPPKS